MLTKAEKVTQLTELSNLVLGIRLFNKQILKGGATLPPVEDLLMSMDTELLTQVQYNLDEVMGQSDLYTAFFLR